MSTALRGGHRLDEPEMPSGQIVLQAPPKIQASEAASGVLMNAFPMLGSMGSIVLVATMGGDGNRTRSLLAAGMVLFTTLGFIIVQVDRQRKQRAQQVTGSRTEYLRYLANVREVARGAAARQRRALTWHHPEPSALPALAEERTRLWEHGPADDNYLHVRYGLSAQPLSLELVPPEGPPVDQVDPAAASALHRLLVVHRSQPDLPASIDLRAFDRVELCGRDADARAAARSMICSATAFHNPDQLVVAVLSSEANLTHWDWVKWLPHAHSNRETDAVGPRRLVATSIDDLGALLPPDLGDRPRFGVDERPPTPHILLVIDGGHLPPDNHVVPPDGLHGVTLLDLPSRWDQLEDPTRLRFQFTQGRPELDKLPVLALRVREEPVEALIDQCDLATAEAFARRIAPLKTISADASSGAAVDITSASPDHMELLGLGDIHTFDPAASWRPRPARDRLRVPIGIGDSGGLVHLDLKESAQQGMGPHGLCIGATGSGKSEFLRTLVLGLTMTHSPEQLNLVLVDFKGGATFAGMADMPHVSAVITNLADELTLVDRMQDALSGEMVRRQELLRDAGNYASVRDYEKARANGEDLIPMPSLLIVVDEFSEMLSAKPEFIDLFVAIGRLGRSLGLHLLLASQRLEEGRLRGLESHLSYRVGLRTFSAPSPARSSGCRTPTSCRPCPAWAI
ncbi:type VII secretion protein EccCa [Nocardioides piscis]|uniref:type VII secretion protein EccCa n=1 Tax=Nocardioides piscis TaxID=2714938 RepID=UPI001FE5FF31|nr:type VII secretion protein EccCa [Nocardioides piscis]